MGETALELRFQNFRLIVDFGFPAVIAFLFLYPDDGLTKQMLLVSLIHELGHGLAICLTKSGLREIRFYAAGIQMKTNACLLTAGQILAVCLSGPLMNLLCAALFWKLDSVTAFLHLGTGVFNLLPYRILDGGAALETLLELNPELLQIRKIFCLMLSVSGIFLLFLYEIRSPALFLMLVYLAVSEFSVDKCGTLW